MGATTWKHTSTNISYPSTSALWVWRCICSNHFLGHHHQHIATRRSSRLCIRRWNRSSTLYLINQPYPRFVPSPMTENPEIKVDDVPCIFATQRDAQNYTEGLAVGQMRLAAAAQSESAKTRLKTHQALVHSRFKQIIPSCKVFPSILRLSWAMDA
jgi:hypothetical protein